jgi:hypothetical protein
MDQFTAVFDVPLTDAVNVALCPPDSDALPGESAISTGVSVMDAVAVLLGSRTLAAVTVTVWRLLRVSGAV